MRYNYTFISVLMLVVTLALSCKNTQGKEDSIGENLFQTAQADKPKSDKEIVKRLCKYIPDHGLVPGSEDYLTKSYYDAYSEAMAAPTGSYGYIGDEEFLYYFIQGNDPAEYLDYSIKSLNAEGDIITATISVLQSWDGSQWIESNETHVVRLVKTGRDGGVGGFFLDDLDDTKQQCVDYVRKMRAAYKSGSIERELRRNGEQEYIPEFKRELSEFYKKYGQTTTLR